MVGDDGTSVQFVVVKSEFCCNTELLEGTSHESVSCAARGLIPNRGNGSSGDGGSGSCRV